MSEAAAAPTASTPDPRATWRGQRARTPTILQMEVVECGAACLGMVLAHYGRWVPMETLREACGVTRDGTKASNICKAARAFGMAARGFRKEPEDLLKLPVPSIIHWNFTHFVVFEGVRGDFAYLNDPATGRVKVRLAELDEGFTGVVIALEPTDAFERSPRPPGVAKVLWKHLGNARGGLWLIGLLTLSLVVPAILIPAFAKIFVDVILLSHMERWLLPLVLGLLATALFRGVTTWMQQQLLLRLELKLSLAMGTDLMHRILRLPAGYFAQRAVGDVASRVAASDRIASMLSGQLASTALQAATAVFIGIILLGYDFLLGLMVWGLTALNVLILHVSGESRRQLARSMMNEQGKLFGNTVSTIRSIETVKSGGLERDAFSTWAGYQAKSLNAAQRLGRLSASLDVLPRLLAGLTSAAVLVFGAMRVMGGHLTIGDLVAFQTLTVSFTSPVVLMMSFGAQLQRIAGDVSRVEDVRRHPLVQEVAPSDDSETEPRIPAGALSVRGLSFAYGPLDPPLIQDFDLELAPGRRVALVGGSGSGKSTVGRLVAGLLPADAGEIRIDGVPIEELSGADRAGTLAYIDQEVVLFEGTLRDNVTLWDASVPDEEVVRALEDAAILEEVSSRPGGLSTPVTEAGANFSGGQRQRLEIARALAAQPALMVLDEATAALDPVSEQRIDASLRRRGITCLIIAHRLSTIRDCDEILVMKQGRVVERGDHDSLLAADGEYARLLGDDAAGDAGGEP